MKNIKRQGFGLLEVVISSVILVTIVGAVVALGAASVRGGLTASDKTMAYNLVQEGLEKVRALRDKSETDGVNNSWDAYLTLTPTGTHFAKISETSDLQLVSLPNVTDDEYKKPLDSNGEDMEDGEKVSVGTPTVDYYRFIKIEDWYDSTTRPAGKKVTCYVVWYSESGIKEIKGSTYLTDWKQIN